MRRLLAGLAGLLVLAFGLGCLNYTKADGLEHHREVAQRHGLPEPTSNTLYLGVLAVVVGSGTIGFVLGRRGRRSGP
jgi:hypothetical protein